MIKNGSLLILSTEEYSDQCHAGPFKALVDFDLVEVAEIVKQMPPPANSWKNKTGPDDVIDYLLDNAFIEAVECQTFHLGMYGNIEVGAV